MTNNEQQQQTLQTRLNVFYGEDNVVVVGMKESWNYNATYSFNGGAHMSYDAATKTIHEMRKQRADTKAAWNK